MFWQKKYNLVDVSNRLHEIRDPIHGFIKLDSEERKLVNSRAFQRLRHIHQLALTYLVYPSATHRRFEHSLGVMDLAGRIYDVVTDPENIRHDSVRNLVPRRGEHEWTYWRRVVRAAALCHDTGHLPFSHAAEKDLLPDGVRHEDLSREIILSDLLAGTFRDLKISSEDVAKIAVGPKYFARAKDNENYQFSTWESILYEIIGGDVFGADRMDYLLRDAYHAGVAYGKFDQLRLIETLRILPREDQESIEPDMGVTIGGLQAAESLLWARYFMYTQLYFHPVRRIYDMHLTEFLTQALPGGKYSIDLNQHLANTDNEVLASIQKASMDPGAAAHATAARITERRHYRLLYESTPLDLERNLNSPELIYSAAQKEFGGDLVRFNPYKSDADSEDFPVLQRDGTITSSVLLSPTFAKPPRFAVAYVFVAPEVKEKAKVWLKENKNAVLAA
jgi:HD superfamily phosphohydrolase